MSPRNQVLGGISLNVWKFILAASLTVPIVSVAQTNMTIYDDSLVNGWSDGSYGVTHSLVNSTPVHSGSRSISATITNAWGAIALNHSSMTTTGFASISFWLNGGSIGGQQLQMYGNLGGVTQGPRPVLASPPAGT